MSSELLLSDRWLKKLDKQTHELASRIGVDRKTIDQVFDKTTLLRLTKLISNNIIDHFDFPISSGKEAIVFRAVTPKKEFVAIKIYRTSNLSFKHLTRYIEGDPRFQIIHNTRRGIIDKWAQKEYKNLQRLQNKAIPAPLPIKQLNNILIMQYIGTSTKPAPLLKDIELSNAQKTFDTIIQIIQKMYTKAKLVHADLSAYNILMHKKKLYIIDLGQAVLLEHPESYQFLQRDIYNITKYFRQYNIQSDPKEIYTTITKIS
ncbi:MAG: serine protein kinase RIO [Thermoplasmatota archaeon]